MDIFNGFNIPVWPTSAVVLQVTFSSLGIFLNFMLLYAHKKDPCKLLRSSSSPFIVNIAVIDFLASCTILANQLAHFSLNVFTFTRPVIIPILHMVILFLESTSFALFLCLSVERFFSPTIIVTPKISDATLIFGDFGLGFMVLGVSGVVFFEESPP